MIALSNLRFDPDEYLGTRGDVELERRNLILGGALAGFAGWLGLTKHNAQAAAPKYEIERSPAEWKRRLTAAQYGVLRDQGTEFPGSSPLNREHRHGVFACAACELPLYRSETKFESGTGWPSFYAPIKNATATSVDRGLLMSRDEVHCRRCGGHLGHVFNDGPAPTGQRLRIPDDLGRWFHGKLGTFSTGRWAAIPREGGRPRMSG